MTRDERQHVAKLKRLHRTECTRFGKIVDRREKLYAKLEPVNKKFKASLKRMRKLAAAIRAIQPNWGLAKPRTAPEVKVSDFEWINGKLYLKEEDAA